jgi:probable HAF family extracellular repeat protein
MHAMKSFRVALIGLAGLLAMSQAAWAAQPQYTVAVVPLPLAPGNFSEGSAINNKGVTVAQRWLPNGSEEAYLCSTTVCKPIPSLGGNQFDDSVMAQGIDDAGNVVGISSHDDLRRAFLFDGRATKDLGGFNEGPCGGCDLPSYGYGINNLGQVVGSAWTSEQRVRAFLWQKGLMMKLDTLGGDSSNAYAINDNGEVVGSSLTAKGERHAFIYRIGKVGDLGTLGGSWSSAHGINQARQVVGCASTPGEAEELAFLYSGRVMQPLKSLGGTRACAYAINGAGWVVGHSTRTPGQQDYHGFVYDGDQVYDLNDTLGDDDRATWEITFAKGINKNGQIVATGKNRLTGTDMALVLTLRSSPR